MLDLNTIHGLLLHYENVSFSMYHCHSEEAKKNLRYASVIGIITIFTTAFTGTASVSLLFQEYQLLKITNIIFSYFIVTLGMVQKSYNPTKRYENHKSASQAYISMYYTIREYVTFNDINAIEIDEIQKWAKQINTTLEEYRKEYPYINDNVYDRVSKNCKGIRSRSKIDVIIKK